MKPYFLQILFICLVLFSSCKDGANPTRQLTDVFKPAKLEMEEINKFIADANDPNHDWATTLKGDSVNAADFFPAFYGTKGLSARWLTKTGLTDDAIELVKQIKESPIEGFQTSDYQIAKIDSFSKLIDAEKISSKNAADLDFLLTLAYTRFSKDLLLGRIDPRKVNKNWQNTNDTTWHIDSLANNLGNEPMNEFLNDQRPKHLWYKKFRSAAERLKLLAETQLDLSTLTETQSYGDTAAVIPELRAILNRLVELPTDTITNKWDIDLVNAIQKYQWVYGLKESGKLDAATKISLTENSDAKLKQLAMNMERLRWLQKDFNDEYIWVNIAQMEVNYYQKDSVAFNMRVVVGRTSRKTPTLDSKLSNIVFNPPWYVPPTIMKEEVLPGIQRRGGSYLSRRGLVAMDSRGRKIDPSRINEKNFQRYSISQKPGRNSALGSVKFNFPNREAIFLHDTNHRGDFGKSYRAYSSGCIRVHHPKDFAAFILKDSTYSLNNIDSIINKKETRSVKITRDIGVHLVYLTNGLDSLGNVVKVNDIYKWDEELKPYF